MTKIYTYLFLLFFAFIGRGALAQCPTETLTVEFDAYEVKEGVHPCGFTKDSLKERLQVILADWLNTSPSSVNVTIANNPPDDGYYTYCNSSEGISNQYTYSGGGQNGTCPVVIKVIDKYHPNCGKRGNFIPTIPVSLNVPNCIVTKEILDDFFSDFSKSEIQKYNNNISYSNFADWNDKMWHCRGQNKHCDVASGLKEAYIDWENTDISNFRIGEVKDDLLEFQYVLLDNAGNRGLRYDRDVLHPCRAKIKVVRTDYNVNFLCPDQSVLSNTEVVLDLPKVPEGDYIVWNTGSKNLKDPNGNGMSNSSYAWTPAADGISVTDFPKEGVYSLTIKGKVCNKTEKSVTCPVNVIKKVETCDPK